MFLSNVKILWLGLGLGLGNSNSNHITISSCNAIFEL